MAKPGITKQQINDAAHMLRLEIDDQNETIANLTNQRTADATTDPLYNAVTLLHEAAMKGVE
jgi:hypothetical protein